MERIKFILDERNPDRISLDRFIDVFIGLPEIVRGFTLAVIGVAIFFFIVIVLPIWISWVVIHIVPSSFYLFEFYPDCQKGNYPSCWSIGSLSLFIIIPVLSLGYVIIKTIKDAFKTKLEIAKFKTMRI